MKKSQPEHQLTSQQKHFVVLSEIRETQREQENTQKKTERIQDDFRVNMTLLTQNNRERIQLSLFLVL